MNKRLDKLGVLFTERETLKTKLTLVELQIELNIGADNKPDTPDNVAGVALTDPHGLTYRPKRKPGRPAKAKDANGASVVAQ